MRPLRRFIPGDLVPSMSLCLVIASFFATAFSERVIARGRPKYMTTYTCENELLTLECERGEVVRIINANYGRFTIDMCNSEGKTEGLDVQCSYRKSGAVISRRCDGHQRCKMLVNNRNFEDPCPATSKYAEVRYTCELAPTVPTTPKPTTTRKPGIPHITLNRPEAPIIKAARPLNSSAIEVVWTQTPPKSPVLTTKAFFVKKGMSTPKLTYPRTNEGNSLVINGLWPGTEYEIHLMSVNKHGSSPASNHVTATTFEKEYFTSTTRLIQIVNTTSTQAPTTTTSTTTVTPSPQPDPEEPDSSGTDDGDSDGNGDRGVQKYCDQKRFKGIDWPKTQHGMVADRSCPKGLTGMATWRCVHSGWHASGPDFSECISSWMADLDKQVQNAMEGKEPADQAAIALSELIGEKMLTPGDLKRAATKFLPKLRKSLLNVSGFDEEKPQRKRRMKKFKQAFMRATSELLSSRQTKAWRSLSHADRRQAATSLILAVEETGFQTAALMNAGSSDVTVDDNVVMEIKSVNTVERFGDLEFPSTNDLDHSPWQGTMDRIVVPRKNLEIAQRKGLVNVVFTIYKNMKELTEPQTKVTTSRQKSSSSDPNYSAGTIIDDSQDNPSTQSSIIINTNIISASINYPKTDWKLPEPVRFTLHHLQPLEKSEPMCSFWDIDSSALIGSWSQDGCRVIESNMSQTTCECDHLTNFAVLMDVSGLLLTVEHAFALHIITYIGCTISIVCLILAWITFTVFKNLQCDRNTIHKNLVLCLLLAEVLFLAGIGQTEYKVMCSVIAGLLHYLFLGAFAWMCLEGIQLYVMLVEVFELEKSRIKWYYLFGYGVPLVIVGVTAAIRHEGYGTDRHCWLSSENYFIWSFVGPALAVVLINCGMLSIAIYTMCRHSNISTTMKERTKVHKFSVSDSYCNMETYASPKLRFPELPAWVKGAVVLVVLLGLTWGVGTLYLSQEAISMAYLFTILNSLQGLFIYIFHCLMNEKVQKEYRKVARRTSWLPDCIRVNYGGYAGVTTSSQNNSSGTGNIFSKLLGSKRRKQSATNSSMKPFLRQDQHRRSSTENSSSRDSSTLPSSLNGYVYKPHYDFVDDSHRPFTNNNGCTKLSINGHAPLEPCYETVECLAGELSECIDCSVIDSEMVSEYCQNNMKVNQEQHRYSTGSENSDYERPRLPTHLEIPGVEADGLSNLSCNSSLKKPLSSFVSTSEVATCSNLDLTEDDLEEDERSLDFHLEQYIIPTRPRNEEDIPMDQKSSSMNILSRPAVSLSSIPEAEASQHHASSPNIQFKPGFSTPMPPSLPNHVQLMNEGFEESNSDNCASPSSDVSSPSSVKSSLPNLSFHTNDPRAENDYDVAKLETPRKQRPFSDADINFSTFKMSASASDC